MKKILVGLVLALALFATSDVFPQARPCTNAAVTQATSVSTAVTVNGTCGTITTFAQTAAAGATVTFTVNNDSVLSTSAPVVSVCSYTGTGWPVVRTGSVTNGSFTVIITNQHASAALNAAMNICFQM